MDDADKLAAATLAAARCAALGQHEVVDYFTQYTEFERLFLQHREAEKKARAAAYTAGLKAYPDI